MAVTSIDIDPVDLLAANELTGSTSNILNCDRHFGDIADATWLSRPPGVRIGMHSVNATRKTPLVDPVQGVVTPVVSLAGGEARRWGGRLVGCSRICCCPYCSIHALGRWRCDATRRRIWIRS